MERSTICERLERFICGSVYAHGSREWRAGQFDIHTDSGESMYDILDMDTPISFNSHFVTRKVLRHDHPNFELMYLLRGRITHRFDDEAVTLGEGDLLIVAPGESHSIDPCSAGTIAVNIMIKDDFLTPDLLRTLALCGPVYELFTGNRGGHLHLQSRGSAEAAAAADMLLGEFLDPDVLTAELVKSHFTTLMCVLYRINADGTGRVYTRSGDGHGDIAFVISYIENNFATASLGEAAQLFGYDRSYLSKLIRRYTGKTFIELKHSFCVEHAKHLLLTTNLPVREVSEQVGFSNVSYFYEVFGTACGMTPAEWREGKASR